MIKTKDRLGEINISNEGYEMKIVKYNNARDILVEFQDEYKAKVHTEYKHFKKGNVKNPYHKNVYNIGYIGEGKYKSKINGKQTNAYIIWCNMLQRCYDPYYINKHLSYINCYVCDEWLNFQNFAEWFYKNIYKCNNERMALDKDILIKGNKIYSPKTCLIVPERINKLFIKSDIARGEYPIGIYYNEKANKLQVQCSIIDVNGKRKKKNLGYYSLTQIKEAFDCYKNFKENYIKQVAEEYKDLIPNDIYRAMIRYEVEIND